MPLQATSGAASYDAFGGGVAAVPQYIEDVFRIWLYTGNSGTQTITNGIDLSTKGGLVWTKKRAAPTSGYEENHNLVDTARGVQKGLASNSDAEQDTNDYVTAFGTTGYTIGNTGQTNQNGDTYVSWTLRKQPKFFDVVTWTGNATNRTIAHSLGSVPGSIFVKRTNTTGAWQVYHRSLANTEYLVLDSTAAKATGATRWNSTTPTSTEFSIGTDATVNASGSTYVAYLFAHNAGGFGLTGTDNVISCGSFDANLGEVINLGYEPQWLLYKDSSSVSNWRIADTMRGFTNLSGTNAQTIQQLSPNTSSAESANSGPVLTSTGFTWNQSGGGNKHIYIAIRRGPMKVPTSGTSVFAAQNNRNGPGSATAPSFVSNFPVDMFMRGYKPGSSASFQWLDDRLRQAYLVTSATNAEAAIDWKFDCQTGVYYQSLASSTSEVGWMFKRAPSFFDEVCYTGNNVYNRAIPHNLAAVPELVIVKNRTTGGSYWAVYTTTTGSSNLLKLNLTNASASNPYAWGSTAASSTNFYVGDDFNTNNLSDNFVMYLFATCAGVSKCFNYTGNGSSQTINCGFTGGARWILIKRTDSTGDWYCWDSARGIVSGNDPHLSLNTTAAEVTSDDTIDTDSTGFVVNQVSATNVNVSSATYIGIAIA